MARLLDIQTNVIRPDDTSELEWLSSALMESAEPFRMVADLDEFHRFVSRTMIVKVEPRIWQTFVADAAATSPDKRTTVAAFVIRALCK
jgi:hypothetical protein